MGKGKGKGKGKGQQQRVTADTKSNSAGELAITVSLPNGTLVGEFKRGAGSKVSELKLEISKIDGTAEVQGDRAPDFHMLLHTTDDPLRPTVLGDELTLHESGVREGAKLVLVQLPFCMECKGKCKEPASHKRQQHVPWSSGATREQRRQEPLPDLSKLLVQNGDYDRYVAWRDEYRRWRRGSSKGASGWVAAEEEGSSDKDNAAWRDSYRSWRLGRPRGAAGESAAASAMPLANLHKQKTKEIEQNPAHSSTDEEQVTKIQEAPAVIFDVVAENPEVPSLVPVDGPPVAAIPIDDFPPDALLTIRVFRFFEDKSDEEQVWEQELQNVNSGSLLWLPVHLAPGMHSKSGAKYGRWFTIHYLQVYAKHFRSAYHMANEGACYPAKTFGSTRAETSTVSGAALAKGYFWYVSPATTQHGLGQAGWQHICRAGPFDGDVFLEEWKKQGSSLDARSLQDVLTVTCKQ
eukprot:gb/GFBE01063752.1/.p1 GENE.gb/GFBE01063752.1/~~gb/GFBE01063752.1/.p1  ORF type:complete len:463 (+),score=97.76 gb/GFBE01063752.1/:1-1389(+)